MENDMKRHGFLMAICFFVYIFYHATIPRMWTCLYAPCTCVACMQPRKHFYSLSACSVSINFHFIGIVEHAVLLGAPVDKDRAAWAKARRVVSGRLVNGYSRADYILGVLYRLRGFLATPAGLVAVACPGVENINFSDIIQGHLDYIAQMDVILDMLGLHGGP